MSGVHLRDVAIWALEAAPILLALPILLKTHRRFPLTDLLYASILLYILALVLGGAHLALDRHPYEALGRFLLGFVLALAAREVLIRGQLLRARGMIALAVACIVLATGAVVELLEWIAALMLGLEELAGTQLNLLVALGGGACALVLFSRLHDKRLKRLDRVSRELEIVPRLAR